MEKAIPATVAPRGVSSGLKAVGFLVAQTRAASFWLMRAGILILYWGCLMLASFLPLRWSFGIARRIGRLTYWRRRRAVEREMATMGPRLGLTPEQTDSTARRAFENASSEDLELCLYSRLSKENFGKLIEIRGLENISKALNDGRGAILYSGHLRGFATLGATWGLLGYKVNHIDRGPRTESREHPIDHCFYQWRRRVIQDKPGIRFLLASETNYSVALQAAKALQRNEIVTVLIDLPLSKRTVEVDFLGMRATFPAGPAVIARSTGAPLLNFYVYRPHTWGPLVAEIGPPYHASQNLTVTMQHCASRLEERILQHPADWATWLFPNWNQHLTPVATADHPQR